jgi:Holliday junction resolvase|tara:strand:- start:4172 stop:4729 length:558 start_codon:yes stop_codon:yes gene_type:complete
MKSNLKIENKVKPLNFKKIAQTRRQRGYNWEDTLVKRFNKMENWKAFRLGSPSVALPDILCVNNEDSMIFTIEAKSGTGTTLTVPFDQITRCLNWTNNFTVYKIRKVVLAFKFLSKKRIGTGLYERRELREYYKVWDGEKKPIDIVCKYDGTTYALVQGEKKKMNLTDYGMPFKSRYQKIAQEEN